MRYLRLHSFTSLQRIIRAAAASLPFVLCAAFPAPLLLLDAPQLRAQSMLTGGLAGTVLDPSGAAIAGALVKATSHETGAVSTTTSSATGAYSFSLLKPGTYTVTASKNGFKASTTTVTVAIGQIVTQNLTLNLGQASETIQVTASPQLLQTDTAQLSTVVNLQQMQDIPNPGSDITYEAQAKPGVVMNTGANSSMGTLGYGNFEVFGLPATSNNFTVNGMEVNDPFLNLNNSGPSNLLLGVNDLQETDVVSNAYEAQYGSFGGVQLNAISRSGTNKFHGNFNYAWNGDVLNANNWFNKNPTYSSPAVARPFSNFNQWAGAVGGPIKRNKVFFFVNTEGISFITSSQTIVLLPSSSFESSVVGADAACDNTTSSLFTSGNASECAFYNHIFALYNGTKNYSSAVPTTTAGQLKLSEPSKFSLTEGMITGRMDFDLTPNDKAFGHFKYDNGTQPTYTDPINSAFDADSKQPDYEGQFAWTHTFGARAVNQFLMTGAYYSAIFVNVNPTVELATFPFMMDWDDGFLQNLNNDADAWPEGRNATQYQLGDDFSYTLGRHTLKAGVQYKKDDISDFDTGILQTPEVLVSQANFSTGISDEAVQDFTTSLDNPLSLYTLGAYFQDDWKPTAKLLVTPGVRVERNSNVICRHNCLSYFGGNFFNLASASPLDSAALPYNQQIKYDLPNAFTNYQAYMVEPRLGFTFSPDGKTVVRGGFGMFTDVFPGTIADTMLDNPPLTTSFVVTAPGMPLQPTSPGSAQALMSGANATFTSQFKAGSSTACPATATPPAVAGDLGSADCMSATNPSFTVPSFTTVAAHLNYPTYEEWNLQIQRQLGRSDSIQIGYVGNHGYHEPVENVGVNAYGPTAGAYGLPGTSPAPSFGNVTEVDSTASSNYNGALVTWVHQGQGLMVQLNYTYSHALDEISNGGILPFNAASVTAQFNPYNLSQNYGNADYDERQNFSGTYLYMIPHYRGAYALTGGWQIGGTIFYNSGNPFTPEAYIGDFGVGAYGNEVNPVPIAAAPGVAHHCGAGSAITPCLTAADFPAYASGTASAFGAAERNQFWGPHYFDTDMTLLKAFRLPPLGEQGKLELGATAFNLLNHPDFGLPNGLIDSGSSSFGYSLYTEGPPTSIYGSGLGGDPSVRILEMTGRIIF